MKKAIIAIIAVLFMVLIVAVSSITTITTGNHGIKSTFGKYESAPLTAGWYVTMPWENIDVVNTREHSMNLVVRQGNIYKLDHNVADDGVANLPSVSCKDKRGIDVTVDSTIKYIIMPSKLPSMIARYGMEWEERQVLTIIRSALRDAVSNYNAEDIPSSRREIQSIAFDLISKAVARLDDGAVSVTSYEIRKVVFSKKTSTAIEAVQLAAQHTKQQQQETLVAQEKANKAVAVAEGNARVVKTRADAEAYSITEVAKAKAEANKILSESMTPQILEAKRIEASKLLFSNPAVKVLPADTKIILGNPLGLSDLTK